MAKKEKDKKSEATSDVEEKSENIVDEEKSEEKAEEKDYNSIFDDDYVEPDSAKAAKDGEDDKEEPKQKIDEVKREDSDEESEETEEKIEEKPELAKEVEAEPKAEEEKPQKQDTKKVKKKSKGFSKKKVLIGLAILLALLLGAFGGYLYFKNSNKPKEEPQTQTNTTTEPKKEETKKEVYVTADGGLNMREAASSSSKSLAVIPSGTKLTVLEEKDGWYKVEYNGQTGWVSKDFVSATKPDDMKTYTGTGFSPDAPKFSIKYPSDWILSGYKVSKTDNGKTYKIALGEGGHGFGEDDATITSSNEDVTYNGLTAKKTTVKKSGNIILIVVNFTKGNDYTNIEFTVPDGYNQSYIDTFDKMLATFKYL